MGFRHSPASNRRLEDEKWIVSCRPTVIQSKHCLTTLADRFEIKLTIVDDQTGKSWRDGNLPPLDSGIVERIARPFV
ncbi:hypothetical protein RRG08_025699 [Elysia crispata]|uniref:Uncharacterized protein n=1 Tax=Elysia crispata TaxID=231223 RepID=A0AAE1AX71_9GAST|nr:hypothetical protein RRG08_025699 [Elysia crispata]